MGKVPESWLLLRSSSWRELRSFSASGTEPENLLVLRWKRVISDNKDSSFTRLPSRFAWFRSIPATMEDSLAAVVPIPSESAQNTPLYEHTLGPTQVSRIFNGSSVMALFHAWSAVNAFFRFATEDPEGPGPGPGPIPIPMPTPRPPLPPTPTPTLMAPFAAFDWSRRRRRRRWWWRIRIRLFSILKKSRQDVQIKLLHSRERVV
ncbi:hypothetical protein CR513_02118, partial [Mucuna pruriens]